MKVTGVQKSNIAVESIHVGIADVCDETDAELRNAAYAASGETPASTYGSHVTRYGDGTVRVSIARD